MQRELSANEGNKCFCRPRESYGELLKLQELSPETYRRVLACVLKNAQAALKKKKKIRMVFIISTIATWIGDELCNEMRKYSWFDVSVIYVWQKNMNCDHERQLVQEHFEGSDIPFRVATENDCAAQYDVLFYLVPCEMVLQR